MPTPAPSPPQAAEPVSPVDRRGRRVYIWWAIGLTLLLAAGLFCWLVVKPIFEVRGVLHRLVLTPGEKMGPAEHVAIQELGGPAEAGGKLSLYSRSPGISGPNRRATAALLSYCGGAAVPVLERLAGDRDHMCRALAARSLGLTEEAGAVPCLLDLLRDKHYSPRTQAAWALWRIPDERAREPLVPLLTELNNTSANYGAACALARLRDKRSVPVLMHALGDTRYRAERGNDQGRRIVSVAVVAAEMLGHLGRDAAQAVPTLEALVAGSGDPTVRQAAAEALEKIKAAQKQEKPKP